MKIISLLATALVLSFALQTSGQGLNSKKGKFYIAWGWNTSKYSNSDMTFKGNDYNFKLTSVKAEDKPSHFSPLIHLNPAKMTIPQTNFKIGYYINDKYSLVLGFDHMKYVMTEGQNSHITGEISNTGTEYDGSYNNNEIQLNPDFLEYENTDGLNYIHLELNRHVVLATFNKKEKEAKSSIELIGGVSIGTMYPRTDAHLLIYSRNNEYHVAGFGTGLKLAGRYTFLKHFFIQPELKGGYIDLIDAKATSDVSESVSQSFLYSQTSIVFGGVINLGKRVAAE